jgi:Flp pilus assembly pilin Flp
MLQMLKALWIQEDGQDLTEYALLMVLVSLVALRSIRVVGSVVNDTFSNASSTLKSGVS